jgi:protein TonB
MTINESAGAAEAIPSPSAITGTTPSSSPATSGSAPIVAQSDLPDAAPPTLIKLVKPDYPQDARMRGVEGWVDISIRVTAAGNVVDPRIEESNRGRMFNRAALVAVQQWKYAPRPTDAQSEERLRVRLEFRLED